MNQFILFEREDKFYGENLILNCSGYIYNGHFI